MFLNIAAAQFQRLAGWAWWENVLLSPGQGGLVQAQSFLTMPTRPAADSGPLLCSTTGSKHAMAAANRIAVLDQ